MKAVHENVAGAKAVDDRGELGGNFLAVDVYNQRGFFGVVQALADADSEEGGIPMHQVASNFLLDDDRRAQDC